MCQVKDEAGLGSEFESTVRVKPRSVSLHDRLYFTLSRVPKYGPTLSSGVHVPRMLCADSCCLLSRAAAEVHGNLLEVDLFHETSGMHANTGPGRTELILVGPLPFPRPELESQTFYVGGHMIRFVDAYR